MDVYYEPNVEIAKGMQQKITIKKYTAPRTPTIHIM
jgi:hypothetical protein